MDVGILKTIDGVVAVDGSRGKGQVESIVDFIGDACQLGDDAGPLRGEVFRFKHDGARTALEEAVRGGTPVELLADHANAVPGLAAVRSAGGTIASYGSAAGEQAERGAELCMHAKLWTRGNEALMPTASAAIGGERQLNLGFRFSGPSARAAGDATEAAIRGDAEEQVATLAAARDHGVLINEPSVGVRHVDEGMALAIDNAERSLSLVVKEFTVPSWAEKLVAAKQRGVDVKVLTREMSPEVRAILKQAGIEEETVPFSKAPGLREVLGRRLHFNAVLADMPDPKAVKAGTVTENPDGYAVVGTRYLWDPSKPGDRAARETAVALDGTNALDAQRAIEGHVGMNRREIIRVTLRGT